jgi:phage shock protein C
MEDKTFYRIPQQGRLGGVSAGIAERTGMDLGLVRFLIIIATLFSGGVFFWIYVILWAFLPKKPLFATTENFTITTNENYLAMRKNGGNQTAGIVLVIIGSIFFLSENFDIDFGRLWPLFMIAFGVYLLFKDKIKGDNDSYSSNDYPSNTGSSDSTL